MKEGFCKSPTDELPVQNTISRAHFVNHEILAATNGFLISFQLWECNPIRQWAVVMSYRHRQFTHSFFLLWRWRIGDFYPCLLLYVLMADPK